MPDRFYLPGEWTRTVELDGTEAHHLANVLRAQPGDWVELFDGAGKSGQAQIRRVTKRLVELELTGEFEITPPSVPQLVVAVASPKGDRLKWMVEKLTELGVDRFIPLKTARGVVDPREAKLAKLEQVVIAACKQSRRSWRMQIDDVMPVGRLRDAFDPANSWVGFGDMEGSPVSSIVSSEGVVRQSVVVIGPEGGLTEEERQLFEDWGFHAISFSRHVLRIETAAIAGAAVLNTFRNSTSI